MYNMRGEHSICSQANANNTRDIRVGASIYATRVVELHLCTRAHNDLRNYKRCRCGIAMMDELMQFWGEAKSLKQEVRPQPPLAMQRVFLFMRIYDIWPR